MDGGETRAGEDDDDGFQALVDAFVREECESGDEREGRTNAHGGWATVNGGERGERAERGAGAGERANAEASREEERSERDGASDGDGVLRTIVGTSDGDACSVVDLTSMFPSTKPKPVGNLGGFEAVTRVKKKRKPRGPPRRKVQPTPKLTDDLVAIMPLPRVMDEDYDAEEAFDDAEEDVEATDTESPEQTLVCDGEDANGTMMFPSSAMKRLERDREEEVVQRVMREEVCVDDDWQPTEVDDGGETDVEDPDEVAQPAKLATIAETDEKSEDVNEDVWADLDAMVVASWYSITENAREIGNAVGVSFTSGVKRQKHDHAPAIVAAPEPAIEAPIADAVATNDVNRVWPISDAYAALPIFGFDHKALAEPSFGDPEDFSRDQFPTSTTAEIVDSPHNILMNSHVEDSPHDFLPGKPISSKRTLLFERVDQLVRSVVAVANVSSTRRSNIRRRAVEKVMAHIPDEVKQTTEQGVRAFLTDARKEKISKLCDDYAHATRGRPKLKQQFDL